MARTKQTFDVAEYPSIEPKEVTKDQLMWLAERPDLALRVRPKGSPCWVYEEANAGDLKGNRSPRRRVLGPLSQYRTKSSAITALNRLMAAEQVVPMVEEFLPRLLADKRSEWAKGTMRQMDKAYRIRVLPTFAKHRIDAIEPVEVRRWFDLMQETPAAADYALAALSVLYDHAARVGIVLANKNPCKGLAVRRSPKPGYHLGKPGLRRLFVALDQATEGHRDYCDLILLILFTGARGGEFINLRWGHIDGLRLRLPESKTGPKIVFLNEPSAAILLKRKTCFEELSPEGYVFFPGRTRESIEKGLRIFWRTLVVEADIEGCRIHDLRHNFAAMAINKGIDLKVIAGLLGHADLTSTSRYARIRENTVRRAAQRTEALIMQRMNGIEGGDRDTGGSV